jgi:hypothetical protein
MRNLTAAVLFATTITVSFGAHLALAQSTQPAGAISTIGAYSAGEDRAFFDKNIGKLVKLEPTPMMGGALEKVFGARFFTVNVGVAGEAVVKTLVAAKVGDNLSDVSMPGATADMPALKALVRQDFTLKTDADGKTFEAALDALYPPDTRYDEKRKAVHHSGAQWTFIRGVFIGDFKGLVVTTDADGTITNIKYSREIKP